MAGITRGQVFASRKRIVRWGFICRGWGVIKALLVCICASEQLSRADRGNAFGSAWLSCENQPCCCGSTILAHNEQLSLHSFPTWHCTALIDYKWFAADDVATRLKKKKHLKKAIRKHERKGIKKVRRGGIRSVAQTEKIASTHGTLGNYEKL